MNITLFLYSALYLNIIKYSRMCLEVKIRVINDSLDSYQQWLLLLLVILWMTFHVQRQMIGSRKTTITVLALERLGARVLAIVPRQFITACESPLATLPRALVRLLTCNEWTSRENVETKRFQLLCLGEAKVAGQNFYGLIIKRMYFSLCDNRINEY